MPKFRVGRLEVHEYPVEVEAKDMVEAIQKVLDGEGDSVDVGIDEGTFIETDEEHGMSLDLLIHEYPELNKPNILKQLGKIVNKKNFIPSIRSVEEIDGDD